MKFESAKLISQKFASKTKARSLNRFTPLAATLDLSVKEVAWLRKGWTDVTWISYTMIHHFECCICNLVVELHKLVVSLLRFGFRRLEKDEDGRTLRRGILQVRRSRTKIKQLVRKQPKRKTKKDERWLAMNLEKNG